MSDQSPEPAAKSPVDAVVEALVYAPIGLLFEGASLLPQLVEKGRNQVTMARMVGRFALEQATEEATKTAGRLQDQAAGVLDFLGGTVTPLAEEPAPVPAPAPRPKGRSTSHATGAARAAARQVAGVSTARASAPSSAPSPQATKPAKAAKAAKPAKSARSTGPAPTAAQLAIPDYDGLSASHVVNRLAGLDPDELEAVRRYEADHRGRKTILSKVAQLQSS